MKSLAFCLLFVAGSALARDWTQEERYWAYAAAAVYTVDYLQTRYIVRHPEEFGEANPFLPSHPTQGDVNRHALISAALVFGVAHLFPDVRLPFLKVVTVGLGLNVARNFYLGVRLTF